MTRTLMLALLLLASGCESTSTEGSCSPVGFMTCSGNDLVTCLADPASDGGIAMRRDCTAEGLVCVGTTSASCGMGSVGDVCMAQNHLTCGDGEILRCVWVSEQPEPCLSGDIGVWRVETACSASGLVCSDLGGGPSCAAS